MPANSKPPPSPSSSNPHATPTRYSTRSILARSPCRGGGLQDWDKARRGRRDRGARGGRRRGLGARARCTSVSPLRREGRERAWEGRKDRRPRESEWRGTCRDRRRSGLSRLGTSRGLGRCKTHRIKLISPEFLERIGRKLETHSRGGSQVTIHIPCPSPFPPSFSPLPLPSSSTSRRRRPHSLV